MFDKTQQVTIDFSDDEGNTVTYGGKDSVVSDIQIVQERNFETIMVGDSSEPRELVPEPIKIEITILIPADKYSVIYSEGESTPKISKKRVKDCSVQELLFAVRNKIK